MGTIANTEDYWGYKNGATCVTSDGATADCADTKKYMCGTKCK